MIEQHLIRVQTEGRGFYDLTDRVQSHIGDSKAGICNVFIHHTSASLLITENADPQVHRDLECFFSRIAPDGDPMFRHVTEGSDDMPAHARSVLTQSSLSIPVTGGHLGLGVWQGIYLWEHRVSPHLRKVTVNLLT